MKASQKLSRVKVIDIDDISDGSDIEVINLDAMDVDLEADSEADLEADLEADSIASLEMD